jgi:hypothetical protein
MLNREYYPEGARKDAKEGEEESLFLFPVFAPFAPSRFRKSP